MNQRDSIYMLIIALLFYLSTAFIDKNEKKSEMNLTGSCGRAIDN